MPVSADIRSANTLNDSLEVLKSKNKIMTQYHTLSYEALDKYYTIGSVRNLDSVILDALQEIRPAVANLEQKLIMVSSTLLARNSCNSNASAAASAASNPAPRKKRKTTRQEVMLWDCSRYYNIVW